VSNSGPCEATGVIVTDQVNRFLLIDTNDVNWIKVDGVPAGDVSQIVQALPTEPQQLTCTVDVPGSNSVEIVVSYLAAPFLGGVGDGSQVYAASPNDGSEFRFVFESGAILEGNAMTGPVYYTDPDGNFTPLNLDGSSLSRNDFFFDPQLQLPGDFPGLGEYGPADSFLLHLSCSDSFPDGWGESAGPVEQFNEDWRISYYSIARYKQGGEFFRNCGNVVTPFRVRNMAVVDGSDCNSPFGPDGTTDERKESNEASVDIKRSMDLDKFQNKAKHAAVHISNYTDEDRAIAYIDAEWPSLNGDLKQITLDGMVIWNGRMSGYSVEGAARQQGIIFGSNLAYIDNTERCTNNSGLCDTAELWTEVPTGWILEDAMQERLAFHFTRKSSQGNYKIRLQFTDGAYLPLIIP
jgi:hypothetical protein